MRRFGWLALTLLAAPSIAFAHVNYLVQRFDPFHVWFLAMTAAVIAVVVIASRSGVSMAACLVILMLAPVVTIVGYEVRGYRHQAESPAIED